jgi:hypothetical protein
MPFHLVSLDIGIWRAKIQSSPTTSSKASAAYRAVDANVLALQQSLHQTADADVQKSCVSDRRAIDDPEGADSVAKSHVDVARAFCGPEGRRWLYQWADEVYVASRLVRSGKA